MSNPSRPVSGFVPLGDVAGEVERPGGRATPKARHHYTSLDQVTQLVGASEADADIGFMGRLLALCSLPRTNPGDRHQYKRVNGPYSLIMTPVGNAKLPYGTLPRLLLAWVCTEAVRTQSRELVLGRSLYEFMRKLGVLSSDSGGVTGVRTRVRNQMRRLFGCSVSLIYEGAEHEVRVSSHVADRTDFWWDTRKPDAPVLWDSTIRLGEDFFNEIIAHPIPLDMNILRSLKRCALGLDLYLWLTYRTFGLKRPLRLSWQQLYLQFGANQAKAGEKRTVDAFRTKCLRELKKIKGSCLAEDREMIHKARHDNEKQVCETCKDFRRQNPRSRPLFRHRFDSAPGGSTERSEPQYREPAVPGLAGTHAAGL